MNSFLIKGVPDKTGFAMKKSIFILSALLLAASCQKAVMEPEAPVEHIRTFTASFSDLTRTSLGDDLTPLWGEGDAIWLSDGVNQEVVGVSAQDIGKATASFTTTTLTGDTVYALYPASCAIGKTSTWSVYFDIPGKTDGAFKNANICVAVATDGEDDLNFKNATSLIRFTKSTADVVSLSIVRPDERMAAGWMSFRPLDGYFLGAGHRVVSGIEVDMSGPGPYYVALYPQPLPVGTKFVMTTSDGKSYVRTINKENEFSLNKIKTISVDAAFTGATPAPTDGWSGSGTETDPYLITSAADLKLLATKVNDRVDNFANKHFKLTKDITVSNYRPIGSTDHSGGFQGNFDGNHHTITIESFDWSYLSTQSSSDYKVYQGLFGWVSGPAITEPIREIKNVLVAGTVNSGSNFLRGPHYYGSVCANATGYLRLEQCGSSLNVTVNAYYQNYASRAKLQAAGGVVGYASENVQISRCYNTGNLTAYTNNNSTGSRFYVGGVCGILNGGLIRLCYNTGNLMGQITQTGYGAFVAGIAASNTTSGHVEGSYNQGQVLAYGPSSSSAKASGITHNAQAIYCYNSGQVIAVYVRSTNTETQYSAGISYRQSGEYQHCFYLDGSAKSAFTGSGGTITDCDSFVKGDAINGGLIGTDARSLVDALNGYEATVYNGDPHFYASPTGDHFPILDYVSRNILDN